MAIGIDHINIAVPQEKLADLVSFYTQIIGLHEGDRPAFSFPGHWLYAKDVDRAVIHLASYQQDEDALAQQTGRFNHWCLNISEPIEQFRQRLTDHELEFREQNNPVNTVIQIFVKDPAGIMLELSFPKTA